MVIETEYKGYRILYNDNSDEWSCSDLDVSDPALSKVKAKIDKILNSRRKLESVSAFYLRTDSKPFTVSLTDATVVEYLGPNVVNDYNVTRLPSGASPKVQRGHKIAVMVGLDGERASRRNMPLSHLVADTPETHAAIKVAQDAGAAAKAADAEYRAAVAAIPRLTTDQIAGLVAVSGLPLTHQAD